MLKIIFGLCFVLLLSSGSVSDAKQVVTPTKVVRTATPQRTATKIAPTPTRIITRTPIPGQPYPSAPLCTEHDVNTFHTLWDDENRCHYDHEHGVNPFTPEIADAFPGYDLFSLLGDIEIGTTNPSGPMENTHKHGGFKWQCDTTAPHGSEIGFEGSAIAIDAYCIEYHNFGDYTMEFEARIHSLTALLRQSKPDNPSDKGYIYTTQIVDYGQRLFSYQGLNMPYPDVPPEYPTGLAPYFTSDCVFCGNKYDTRQARVNSNSNVSTTWTAKRQDRFGRQTLLAVLFRARDLYQVVNQTDQIYPFTFQWMCSLDGGLTYTARMTGCRWNNSTSMIHEVQGVIPASWDNQSFDSDRRLGRITATIYTDDLGNRNPDCDAAGASCHPVVMISAFIGYYGSELVESKTVQFNHIGLPERDIYFCNGQVCGEFDLGAASSKWIGQNN